MINSRVESVASSIVREYLSRKGLRTTLQVMDEEMPRTENSISNRQALVKELHIEQLMRINKLSEQPLRTMLEVISKDLLENPCNDETIPNDPAPYQQRKQRLAAHSNTSKTSTETQYLLQQKSVVDELSQDNSVDVNASAPQSTTRIEMTCTETALTGNSENANDVLRISSSDLILEDSVEGETVLGSGKTGLLEQNIDNVDTGVQKNHHRPRSSRSRGLLGPITSSLEDKGRRRFQKPRPLSSVNKSNQKNNQFDTQTEVNGVSNASQARTYTQNGRLERVGSSSSFEDSKLDDIETLISKPIVPKSTIEDVLEIDQSRPRTGGSRRHSSSDSNKHYSMQTSSIGNSHPQSRGGNQSRPVNEHRKSKVGDLEIGDVDDMDTDLSTLDLGPRLPIGKSLQSAVDSRPIDVKTAVMLKALMFGSASKSFNDEWHYQSFTFCDLPNLGYGLVQKKGGPCGILAAMQACVLQELLFTDNKIPVNRSFDPNHEERSNALAVALSKVIWRAGEQKRAIVTIPSGKSIFSGSSRYRADELTETLMLNHFKTLDELICFMKQCIGQFELDGYSGVILLLYSSVLSRGIEVVKNDMDEPGSKLMGAHHYCTQEIVNLLLTGRAVSNVFNDIVELESGNDTVMLLKGINARSDIGLISLFEHFNSCQVGTYYKTPKYPIWIVCSESHFSVLFSIKKDLVSDWKAERRFDLYYYDGLARQQEQIKLTIETINKFFKPPSDEELVPPLEHCIRTKWADAEIDWNGTEPLL